MLRQRLVQTKMERHENAISKQENDNLWIENVAIKEAIRSGMQQLRGTSNCHCFLMWSGEWMRLDAAVDWNRVPTVPVEVMRLFLRFLLDARCRRKLQDRKSGRMRISISPPCAVVVAESVPVDQCSDESGIDVKYLKFVFFFVSTPQQTFKQTGKELKMNCGRCCSYVSGRNNDVERVVWTFKFKLCDDCYWVETTFLPMVCFRTVVARRESDYLCLTMLMPLT
ncbi:hypothetical protein Hanom_Chr16g01519871 [Helianthus anomalus]